MNTTFAKLNSETTDFPAYGTQREKSRFLLKYAVLAPSKYNVQPWGFDISGNSVEVICNRHGALQQSDPNNRELIMSCGAAVFNFRVAAAHFGCETNVQAFPYHGDGFLVARIFLRNGVTENLANSPRHSALVNDDDNVKLETQDSNSPDDELFQAILIRHTVGGNFRDRTPSDKALTLCRRAAVCNGAWLRLIRNKWTQRKIGRLVAKADRVQMADQLFREELAMWIRPDDGRTKAGMPASAYGLPECLNFLTTTLSHLVFSFNIGRFVAYRDRNLAQNSPALAVIGTAEDSPKAWLAAGQALEAVLLQATAAGLGASFLNQPVQVSYLRKDLLHVINATGFPQALLRLGYAKRGNDTPRRPLDDVVTTN